MQFFPAMGAGPGQSFSAGFRGESQDTMPGLDFSGFLSREFEQPAPEASRPAEAAPLNDSGASDSASRAWDGEAAARDEWTVSAAGEETPAGPAHAPEKMDDAGRGVREPAAKAAGREGADARKTDRDASRSGDSGKSAKENASVAQDADPADADEDGEALVSALGADLARVTREVSGLAAANPEVAARIEALHGLMRQFQSSAPAERKELAVALGERIKALKELLAGSAAGAKTASDGSGKAVAHGAREAAAGASVRVVARDGVIGDSGAGRTSAVASEAGAGRHAVKNGAHVSTADAGDRPGVSVRESESGNRAKAAAAAGEGRAPKTSGDQAGTEGTGGRTGVPEAQVAGGKGSDVIEERGTPQGKASGSREAAQEAALEAASEKAPQTTPEIAKKAPSSRQEGSSGTDAGKVRDARPEHAQMQARQDRTEREGEKAATADQASREIPKHSSGEDAPKKAQDLAPREAAKNGAAAAGLADRQQKAREKADAQNQPLSTDASQDGDARHRGVSVSAEAGGERPRRDARDGFFGPRAEKKTAPARSGSMVSGKTVTETESQLQGAGLNSQPPVAGSRLDSPVNARSAEVYRQVESGAFRNLGQGVRQLVLHLDPADLGQVSVILRVKGNEIQAVLRASSQETSQVLGEQMAQLRTQLESQGLKVGRLEVQTQMADSQQQSQWQGAEQHNRYQENRELALSAQRWRTMERVDGGLVRDVQSAPQREKLSSSGLDIFA